MSSRSTAAPLRAAWVGFAAAIAAAAPAHAKTFSNSYVSFELPERWECEFRDTEFVCRNNNDPQAKREAVIILTAKEVGPQDNLVDYEAHLKTPRTLPSRTGVPQPSQMLRTEKNQIADQVWIDGLHVASEVPNYYTRYLATVKDKIGILVTFSAHSTVYPKYVQEFMRAIRSLRVTFSRSALAANRDGEGGLNGASGGGGFDALVDDAADPMNGSGGGGSSAVGLAFAGGGIALGALGLLLLLRRKKDAKPRSGPPSIRR